MALTSLTDDELVARLEVICGKERQVLARLIVHLIEVDERQLHLRVACSSLFDFVPGGSG